MNASKQTKKIRSDILKYLKNHNTVIRERFICWPLTTKEQQKMMRIVNKVFQSLVVQGILYSNRHTRLKRTVGHSCEYEPKIWHRRKAI